MFRFDSGCVGQAETQAEDDVHTEETHLQTSVRVHQQDRGHGGER